MQSLGLFALLLLLSSAAFAQPQQQSQGGFFQTLRERTCNNGTPGPPRNLYVIPGDSRIEATYWAPNNRPCQVVYEVAAAPIKGNGQVVRAETSENRFLFTGLVNDIAYEVTVAARSPIGKGPAIQSTATPSAPSTFAWSPLGATEKRDNSNNNSNANNNGRWRCVAEESAAICPAAASRLCNTMSCEEVSRRGLCSDEFMRATNWEKREIKQYCSQRCGCSASPSLRQSLGGPRSDACCAIQAAEYFQDENGRPTNGLAV